MFVVYFVFLRNHGMSQLQCLDHCVNKKVKGQLLFDFLTKCDSLIEKGQVNKCDCII